MDAWVIWAKVPRSEITPDEYESARTALLRERGEPSEALKLPCCPLLRCVGRWGWADGPNRRDLRIVDPDGRARVLSLHSSGRTDSPAMTGREAFEAFEAAVRNHSLTFSFKRYFGTGSKDLKAYCKRCVVSPFDYASPIAIGRDLHPVAKADVSCAYASALLLPLPTMRAFAKAKGRADPNQFYPFAFCPRSRHIAIWDHGRVISSRDLRWTDYPYAKRDDRYWNPLDYVSDEEDDTILLREADESAEAAVKEAVMDLYSTRGDHPENKLIMNAAIGYMQARADPFASALSAVVVFRTAYAMVRRCQALRKIGNWPILVNTDSISWIGEGGGAPIIPTWVSEKKEIGAFVLEEKTARMMIKGPKSYQYYDDGGALTTVLAGVRKEESEKMGYGDIMKIGQGDKTIRYESDGSISVERSEG